MLGAILAAGNAKRQPGAGACDAGTTASALVLALKSGAAWFAPRPTQSASRATKSAPLNAESAINTVRLSKPIRPMRSSESRFASGRVEGRLLGRSTLAGKGAAGSTLGVAAAALCASPATPGTGVECRVRSLNLGALNCGVSSCPGAPKLGMGVVAARGDESSAGTGTPRAGGGTAPGGRSVAVAEGAPCSSDKVGSGERPRTGAKDALARAECGEKSPGRRLGPITPKLLGASVSRGLGGAGSEFGAEVGAGAGTAARFGTDGVRAGTGFGSVAVCAAAWVWGVARG